ncbi:MAG TPA: phage/plasmid primase, P4 family [Clostridia bacterium]|nr:phage/plasmid primase, P4 family [Clostridia bacterium]
MLNTDGTVVPDNGFQMPDSHDPNKYMIDGKFNPKLMADILLSEFHFFAYAETESIYVYEDGIYKPTGIYFIKKEMLERLGKYFRIGQVKEVTQQIKIKSMIDRYKINSERHLINLNNGIFDTKEWKFKKHDPRFLSTIRIPKTYDPDAKCPIINRFLDDVVSQKDKQTLIEWSGLMLIIETMFEKAMMLCGSGGNGKSTFINLLTALIGDENTTAIPLQKLIDENNNKFIVAHLHEKLMNVCADIPSTTIHNSDMFKRLVGKDKITGEHKFGHPFEFYNPARLIFSARIIPNLAEIGDEAYYRRWLIVEFLNRFTGESDDKDMQNKLTTDTELSGFLNLALAGLKTILQNGRFTHELSIQDTAYLYIKKANPVYKFSEECIVSSPNDILKNEVYLEYLRWCEQYNEKPMNNNIFGKNMKALRYLSVQKGDSKYYWEGIAIKTNTKRIRNP